MTGESAMLLKVRTRDTQSLEYLLERIHAIEGFKGTRSYIALSTLSLLEATSDSIDGAGHRGRVLK